jgi:TatD DNase family protein
LDQVRSYAAHPGVIAIGETGLDKASGTPYDIQLPVFEKQMKIAGSLGKALIIHCVRSYSEMLFYRKKSDQSLPWIFHWFNADEQTAAELIRKNCYLSFGHMLFREQSRAYRTFASMAPDHLFFETDDAGYTIRQIYERAAAIRNISVEELKAQIIDNFDRCFKGICHG